MSSTLRRTKQDRNATKRQSGRATTFGGEAPDPLGRRRGSAELSRLERGAAPGQPDQERAGRRDQERGQRGAEPAGRDEPEGRLDPGPEPLPWPDQPRVDQLIGQEPG